MGENLNFDFHGNMILHNAFWTSPGSIYIRERLTLAINNCGKLGPNTLCCDCGNQPHLKVGPLYFPQVELPLPYNTIVLAVGVRLSEMDSVLCVSLLALWPLMTHWGCFSAFHLMRAGIHSSTLSSSRRVRWHKQWIRQQQTLKTCIRKPFQSIALV